MGFTPVAVPLFVLLAAGNRAGGRKERQTVGVRGGRKAASFANLSYFITFLS